MVKLQDMEDDTLFEHPHYIPAKKIVSGETYHGKPVEVTVESLRNQSPDYYTTTQAISGGGYIYNAQGCIGWFPFKVIDKLDIRRKSNFWE